MAEFCKCGSLLINGQCTNKSCGIRMMDKQVPVKATTVKKVRTISEKAPAKTTKTRRSSKCITYNLYEPQSEEGNNS